MPKNTTCPGVPWVTDPITDQEIAETAAHTKAKPRVRAYMIEHRAADLAKQTLPWAAALKSQKAQILSNFMKYPAHFTRGNDKGNPGRGTFRNYGSPFFAVSTEGSTPACPFNACCQPRIPISPGNPKLDKPT